MSEPIKLVKQQDGTRKWVDGIITSYGELWINSSMC